MVTYNSDHVHTLFAQRLLSVLHPKQTSLLQRAQQSPVLICVDCANSDVYMQIPCAGSAEDVFVKSAHQLMR